MPKEAVHHPPHYNQYHGLEIIDLVRRMSFNLGNAVKYIARAGAKDPSKEIEDLEKAVFYIRDEIENRPSYLPVDQKIYGGLHLLLSSQLGLYRGAAVELICLGHVGTLRETIGILKMEIEKLKNSVDERYEAILDLVKESMGAAYQESYYGEKDFTAAEIAQKIYNLK